MECRDCNRYPPIMTWHETKSMQQHLEALLGLSARNRSTARTDAVRNGDGYRICELSLLSGGRVIPATALIPEAPNGTGILYCHAHGDRYDIGRRELLEGRPAVEPAFGPELARSGFTVLCPDMPGFGERRHEGTESSLAKAALWRGETLLGMMLADLMGALDILEAMPEIESVGAFGISMGATLSYWLAALDQRVSAVAHVCAFSDIEPLVASGAHDLHGIYMTVPGMLREIDMGDIAASIAPRPQFIASGGRDPLTPDTALAPALAKVRDAYRGGGPLTVLTLAETGHAFAPEMRAAVLAFLRDTVSGVRQRPEV
jgi:pimeloyl-ACP methyl ester carboxylesterase